jgi:glycosyltransferase involved in cell wall biosynthesis
MRIGFFHNRYRYRGGEDVVVDAQIELLAKAGHEVSLCSVDNREEIQGFRAAARAARRARWNPLTPEKAIAFLDAHPVDVAHIHNTFPLFSPALHHTLSEWGVPIVQTLHNYRLVCANASLLRNGAPCTECIRRGPWNAVRHGCYRGSRLQTAVWADMTAHHRRQGTWTECVDLFTTPSSFARQLLIDAGMPADRMRVLSNPVLDPGPPVPLGEGGAYVGRLSPEKGVSLLIEAWRCLPGDVPLRIVGTGPEAARLRVQASDMPNVEFLGAVSHDRALGVMSRAAFVVAPSLWYETFGMVVLEAMACGRAVIVPRESAFAELVDAGRTGLHYASGDAESLGQACATLIGDRELTRAQGEEARSTYEDDFAPERVLGELEALYESLAR